MVPAKPGPTIRKSNFSTKVALIPSVRPGWQISGDGMYSTTIQVVGNVAGRHSVEVFRSEPSIATDNVTIRDLTGMALR